MRERINLAQMWLYLLIAIGGALGSVARYFLAGVAALQFGDAFPWGTLLVNVTGCFAIGLIATLTAPEGGLVANVNTRQFLMAGVLGGYTTFSSFSLQTLTLMREGEWLRAGANTIGSVAACLVAVWLGHLAAAAFQPLKAS